MTSIKSITKFTNPLGGQFVELQQLNYESGGMGLLRTRIREKSRFTIFEIDSGTARLWGEALVAWANSQTDSPLVVGASDANMTPPEPSQ